MCLHVSMFCIEAKINSISVIVDISHGEIKSAHNTTNRKWYENDAYLHDMLHSAKNEFC